VWFSLMAVLILCRCFFMDGGDTAVDFLDPGFGFLPVAAEFLFTAHHCWALSKASW